MKKKLRRQLKGFFQIGNYIYANGQGKIAIVVERKERVTDVKIAADFKRLIELYGINEAVNYITYIKNFIK